MRLKDWERDVINRQRNIVFPDTVLNQGRYYRNLVSEKAVFSLGQKLSVLALIGIYVALNIPPFLDLFFPNPLYKRDDAFLVVYSLNFVALLFWIAVAFRAFFPAPEPRKRRRGYRRSAIE